MPKLPWEECEFRDKAACGHEFCILDKELCPESEPRSDCPYDNLLEGTKRGLEAYRQGRVKLWSEVKKELGI